MKLEMFQKIRLKDERVGHIIEIFNDGEAYMIDIATEDGEYEQVTVYATDIKSTIVEVDQPFVLAV
ncbi:MAG: hypothetical protein FWH24_00710 [Oscillospiraceae bacterium]|nr:hypothetical protein [Oscillospiraceae bacterium]